MASAAPATAQPQPPSQQPTLPPSRPEGNSSRNEHSSHSTSTKTDKTRAEGNGTVKQDASKHRQRPDPTCSAARTEIHHITKSDANKGNHKSENHSRADSKSDPATEASKIRPETIKVNSVKVRPDLVRPDPPPSIRAEAALPSSKPKADSQKANSSARIPDANKPRLQETDGGAKNRCDSLPKTEPIPISKPEAVPCDLSQPNNANSKLVKPSKASPNVTSSRASSLASFVDSGFPWKEDVPVLDLTEDAPSRKSSKPSEPDHHRSEPPPVVKTSSAPPKVEETEDQESLLQRDLAMVLEEISQITQQGESKDQQQQPTATSKPSAESRTKSVIKATGRASPGVSAPPSTAPSVAQKPLVSSASPALPKLTAAPRSPPHSISSSLSQTSSTGNNAKVISSAHLTSSPPIASSGKLLNCLVRIRLV